jgi:hypothetical protein
LSFGTTARRHLLKPAELPTGGDHAPREEADVGEGGRGREVGQRLRDYKGAADQSHQDYRVAA